MKIRKRLITALLATSVLCMSFSTLAFAAPSPQPPDKQDTSALYFGGYIGVTPDGEPSYAEKDEYDMPFIQTIGGQDALKAILNQAGIPVASDQSVVVLDAGGYSIVEGSSVPATFAFAIKDADSKGVKEGDTVYYMTRGVDGTWKVVQTVVTTNDKGELVVKGDLTEKYTDVAIVKIMSNGDVKVYDSNKNEIGKVEGGKVVKTTTSTAKKSPKTGE